MKISIYLLLLLTFFSCGPTPMQRHDLYSGTVAEQQIKQGSNAQNTCNCTFQNDPVCGVDGADYDNPCIANCKGVKFTKGICPL